MSASDVQVRARHARDFLGTAEDALALHPHRANVVISNAVLAGIAAADAICGRLRGEAARGDGHDEALRLLGSTGPAARPQVNDLRRLLALKTNSQYSPLVLTGADAQDAVRWAARLTAAMDEVLAGP